MSIISDNIRYLRKKNKMSQPQLADKVNRSESTIQMWETDLRSPTMGMVTKLADIFNIDINSLVYEDLEKGIKNKSGTIEKTIGIRIPLLPEDIELDFKISIDNRNISVGKLLELETYLLTEFCLHKYKFKVEYFDSKRNYGIQIADLVSNISYMRFHDRSIQENLLKELEHKNFRFCSFPGKKFIGRKEKITW